MPGWRQRWLLEYDVTNAGVAVDALGKLNRANVGAPNQRFRAAAGASWSKDAVRVTGLLRHVDGYQADAGGSIDSFTTLDLNARWSLGWRLGDRFNASVTVGAANLLDEDPPFVNIAGSYDPRSADPRGRRVFQKGRRYPTLDLRRPARAQGVRVLRTGAVKREGCGSPG